MVVVNSLHFAILEVMLYDKVHYADTRILSFLFYVKSWIQGGF